MVWYYNTPSLSLGDALGFSVSLCLFLSRSLSLGFSAPGGLVWVSTSVASLSERRRCLAD